LLVENGRCSYEVSFCPAVVYLAKVDLPAAGGRRFDVLLAHDLGDPQLTDRAGDFVDGNAGGLLP
jgi:hypothetical protein